MYKKILEQLRQRQPPAPLFPTAVWNADLSRQIVETRDDDLFGNSATDDEEREMRLACRAGLLLLNDDLEASHYISQGIETPTGAFWHAVMHRREGDLGNSQYWWRKTGTHPAFDDVYTEVMSTLMSADETPEAREFAQKLEQAGVWQPMDFVSECEAVQQSGQEPEWLRRVQLAEMTALLQWCRERSE